MTQLPIACRYGARLRRLASFTAAIIACNVLHAPAQSSEGIQAFETASFSLMRDTLWVLDSVYLEVRLDRQTIYQHFRSGTTKKYLCSTGTPRISDGIATREGIFSVVSRAKRTMSQQFQVYLNYWMGFDGGIGFHGLDTRSYYRFLGRKPSSHGCVRISNETGKELFPLTPVGTVVWVHSGTPARVLAFADSSKTDLTVVTDEDTELLGKRLQAITDRRIDDPALQQDLALPAGKKGFRKIAVGQVAHSWRAQRRLPVISESLAPPLPGPQAYVSSARPVFRPAADIDTESDL